MQTFAAQVIELFAVEEERRDVARRAAAAAARRAESEGSGDPSEQIEE
ncbi:MULTISPECIES: hypothetical protein [Streptomyces]|nr:MULTISPECIES: hypothetical protein [Streptomyces]UFQ16429.1 hypothetical protein J2N69_16250 [Streptomyces huasconensis]WCL86031.1 hypothetical protein PPN52_16260 [Streptomyces sp. JCM 35825]